MLHHIRLILAVLVVSSVVVGIMGHGAAGETFAGVTTHRSQFGFLMGLLILMGLFDVLQRPMTLRCLFMLSCAALLTGGVRKYSLEFKPYSTHPRAPV
jgi:hypothetical protein